MPRTKKAESVAKDNQKKIDLDLSSSFLADRRSAAVAVSDQPCGPDRLRIFLICLRVPFPPDRGDE